MFLNMKRGVQKVENRLSGHPHFVGLNYWIKNARTYPLILLVNGTSLNFTISPV